MEVRVGWRFPTDANTLTTKVHPLTGMARTLARLAAPIGLLFAMLLAGCTTVPDGSDEPGLLDPIPSAPPSSSPSNPGFAPQQGVVSNTTNGIRLDATWETCDDGFCANVTARNVGSTTYQVSNICQSPWFDLMAHEGEPVKHRPLQIMCAAYGRAPFAPGDEATAQFSWDGQVWQEEGLHEREKPAPQGAYEWTLVYWFEEQEGGPRLESAIALDLILGPT